MLAVQQCIASHISYGASCAAVETLRAQNNSLHVTMERLLGTNSELGTKVNSQAAHISSLEAALAEARAKGPAPPASVEPAGVHACKPLPPRICLTTFKPIC